MLLILTNNAMMLNSSILTSARKWLCCVAFWTSVQSAGRFNYKVDRRRASLRPQRDKRRNLIKAGCWPSAGQKRMCDARSHCCSRWLTTDVASQESTGLSMIDSSIFGGRVGQGGSERWGGGGQRPKEWEEVSTLWARGCWELGGIAGWVRLKNV